MPVVVRRLRADEALSYREIRLAALADTPEAFSSTHADESARPMASWLDRAATGATSDVSAIFVAEESDNWIGLVGGHREEPDSTSVQLVSMWVAPEARGRGLGRALTEAVLGWAGDIGVHEVQLWVMTGNDPALALYESVGFETDGTYQALPSDPCKNEVRMRRLAGGTERPEG